MKTAIFGGSFNPIHNGHLNLLNSLDRIYNFDRIILIPTGIPPHKSGKDYISAEDRLEMCRLACKDSNKLQVSDIEIKRQGISYTVDTVIEIKRLYPKDEFYLLIGGDMLMIFDKWREYIKLSKLVNVLCCARTDSEYEELIKKAEELSLNDCRVIVQKTNAVEVSSTEIRRLCSCGKAIEKLVPMSVCNFINERNLYKAGGENKEVQ